MTFLKSLWRKLFQRKTGSFDTEAPLLMPRIWVSKEEIKALYPSYDPSQDPEKLLRGEVESYFD